MKVFDLSHEINETIGVYPGDPKPRIIKDADIINDGFRMHRLEFHTHLATHIDAPGHILENGKMIDRFPIEHFTGAAFIIKAHYDAERIIDFELPQKIDFEHLIINSGWYKKWGWEAYYRKYPVLSTDMANKIAAYSFKTVSVDTPSVDRLSDADYPIHKIFLKKDILIIENITSLDELNGQRVDFFAFPLKIKSVDGSLLRVVGIKE